MCGICGVIYKNRDNSINPVWLKTIADTLNHRGPDGEGFYIKKNVGLAHKRLSIIDVAGGQQPIFNEDKSLSIVYNGEIYNHENLRKKFEEKGHLYATKSDTESIIHAYEEYGYKCVDYLRGMFAIAIYDVRKKILFLARDRVGKKPLYYYKDEDVFLFASEIKAILKTGMVKKEVNKQAIDFYISLGYVPGRETLFKNIFKLEPAHYLVLDEKHQVRISEYWDIKNIAVEKISYNDAYCRVKEKLLESVKIRLMSEVPLGVFLSGGLDSSTIVALMSKIVSEPIKTFSVGYRNEPKSSELQYAKIIADKFRTEHHEFFLTPDDLFDSIDTFLEHTEEPIVESAGIALYKLAKLAKSHATVLLSGEGADEILAGYPIYLRMEIMEKMHYLTKIIPTNLLGRFRSLNNTSEKINKYLDWVGLPFSKRYRSVSFDVSGSIREKMYSKQFRNSLSGKFDDYFISLHKNISDKTMLRRMLYIDTKSWLAEDILLKADRMTMAASLELRAPFLDQELIELVTSLPDSLKLNKYTGKYLLKQIVKDILPKEIINRKKKGFPVPLTAWFRGELQQRAKLLLTVERALSRNYFNREYVHGLFDRINNGEDLGKRLFALVTLELWHRKYID